MGLDASWRYSAHTQISLAHVSISQSEPDEDHSGVARRGPRGEQRQERGCHHPCEDAFLDQGMPFTCTRSFQGVVLTTRITRD